MRLYARAKLKPGSSAGAHNLTRDRSAGAHNLTHIARLGVKINGMFDALGGDREKILLRRPQLSFSAKFGRRNI